MMGKPQRIFLERAHRIADSLEPGIAVQKGEIMQRRQRSGWTMPPVGSWKDQQ